MDMFSLGSMLNQSQMLTNLRLYEKKDNDSLYKKRCESGAYEKLAEIDKELAAMQQYVDRMNADAETVMEKLTNPGASTEMVLAKLNAGKKLSSSEMEHLRRHAPDAYTKAKQIEAERAAHEEKLKRCKTKEDVERLRMSSVSLTMSRVNSIVNNPHIPDDKKLEMVTHENQRLKAITEATVEFVTSVQYAQLPSDAERNAAIKAEREAREVQMQPAEESESTGTEQAAAQQSVQSQAQIPEMQPESAETPAFFQQETAAPAAAQAEPADKSAPSASEGKPEDGASPQPERDAVKAAHAHQAYTRINKRRE